VHTPLGMGAPHVPPPVTPLAPLGAFDLPREAMPLVESLGPSPKSDGGSDRLLWTSNAVQAPIRLDTDHEKMLPIALPLSTSGQQLETFALLKPLVLAMLDYHAGRGDVQTCAVVSQVLHSVAPDLIPKERRQRWLLSYIELLQRLQLFELANAVIKSSDIERVSAMNTLSTSINQQRPQGAGCSVCQLPVRGLYSWCQGCGHGGHAKHMRTWFQGNLECPTGCGHRCQLRLVPPARNEQPYPSLKPVDQRSSTELKLLEIASDCEAHMKGPTTVLRQL